MNEQTTYQVYSVNGPVVKARGGSGLALQDMAFVGVSRLIGEVVAVSRQEVTIQVYEPTTGVAPGQPVAPADGPLSIQLGPGLLGGIFDGIARPLRAIEKAGGAFIPAGLDLPSLDGEKKWPVKILVNPGDRVEGGAVFAQCDELGAITHKAMVPPNLSGEIMEAAPNGNYTVNQPVALLRDDQGREHKLTLAQKWPIRQPRPVKLRRPVDQLMVTGQRVIDAMFPIGKGGCACVPGPFGAGKTIIQHQLAKWCDADIIIYLGCGERGNEMTDVLREFPELKDPRTGESLMQRTVLIANTSDMPVAAREASVYTGITIAEYYRDMGYNVAVIADSTSRWAEALREMSGRLEEMPGEEGYPAYLGSRLAQFYERAGRVVCNGEDGRIGSLSAIGAVSPPGGDISEPVSQATLRIVKVFWGLDSALAYARHFPAINWLNSYSLYFDRLRPWYEDNVSPDFIANRNEAMKLLQQEAELKEIVQLVGIDALSPADRLVMETAQMIREDFLQQNAMSDTDSYCEIDKQFRLLELILLYYNTARQAIQDGAPMAPLFNIEARAKIGRAKDVHKDVYQEQYNQIEAEIRQQIAQVSAGGENA